MEEERKGTKRGGDKGDKAAPVAVQQLVEQIAAVVARTCAEEGTKDKAA